MKKNLFKILYLMDINLRDLKIVPLHPAQNPFLLKHIVLGSLEQRKGFLFNGSLIMMGG